MNFPLWCFNFLDRTMLIEWQTSISPAATSRREQKILHSTRWPVMIGSYNFLDEGETGMREIQAGKKPRQIEAWAENQRSRELLINSGSPMFTRGLRCVQFLSWKCWLVKKCLWTLSIYYVLRPKLSLLENAQKDLLSLNLIGEERITPMKQQLSG